MHWVDSKDRYPKYLLSDSGVGLGYVQEVAGILVMGVRGVGESNHLFDRKPFASLGSLEPTEENIKKAKMAVEFEARLRGAR